VCEILPAVHGLTGCDTTYSFFGIGKKSMLKALKETPNQFSDLSRIECSDIVQPCSRGDPATGFGICAFNHIFVWYEDLRTCCLNVSSLGGSLTKAI
jgi:hypothetical protein